MKAVLRWKHIRDLFIAAVIVIVCSLSIILLEDHSLLRYWPWFLVAAAVLTIWHLTTEAIGRWRHRSIIQGRRLRWLTELGFSVENIGDYWGYKGTYHSYFIRIFYSWESNLEKLNNELSIMVYFQPLLLENGNFNVSWLGQANAALPTLSYVYTSTMDYKASYLVNHTPITFLTSRKRIRKRLDRAVAKVMESKLKPIGESAVHELVKRNPWHGPSIESFRLAYGINE